MSGVSRPTHFAVAAATTALAVVLDQGSKAWALERLSDNRTVELVPTIELDLTFNSGFSFGTGSGNGAVVGLLVIAVCGILARLIWREERLARAIIYSTILGGALGNLTDRIFRADDGVLSGEVVDFVDVSWYAVFNVADVFVVCGCIAVVLDEILNARRLARSTPTATQTTTPD